ncbi:hypothetical protein P3X46_004517 [Hevea brasiliensis]|uniref:Mitochondrial glycoprotein n=1 Tax=Hevea brasiliensis TaxID=3981 RepID=A0ABQ9MYV3_HEVBR|nr:uncharacterized protein At2g39795, mitochondrial-like [Hevea brasiliensis]KAJ9184830.1 hypothetical protein P3X46_004517 [Hevea brasiliensis]
MPRRATQILQNGRKVLEDLDLLKVLQSEIKHELSSPPLQDNRRGSLGDFSVDWDSSDSQDVVLRRKCETGEQVVVSALSRPSCFAEGSTSPWEFLMKVFVKKPGLNSVLQFDCGIYEIGPSRSVFDIHNAYYLQSTTCPGPSAYGGPYFSDLDPHLRIALKEYLVAKGISESLTNFLFLHLRKKEQGQYGNWLQKLELFVAKEE